ncbi:MAG TPA: cupin domain-containing protein [Mycobacterium sp.]|nr:cupin domain-containing protein [Mycobacterium sp.]
MKANAVVHAAAHRLELEPVATEQSVAGDPSTGVAELGRFGGLDVGIWEMTPGVMRDVEAEDAFVVLCGAATVEFADGTAALTLGPGDVVRLTAGAETVWTVTETLRKVYLT